jgi:hypothetical protein
MIQWRIAGLRQLAVRPLGLTADAHGPVPVMLGSESRELGIRSGLRAVVTRSPKQPGSLGLYYGGVLPVVSAAG